MYTTLIVIGPIFACYILFLSFLNVKLTPAYLSIFVMIYGLPAVLIAPAKMIESKFLKWFTHIGSAMILINIFMFFLFSLYFGEKVVDLYSVGCTGTEKSPEMLLLEKNHEQTTLEEVTSIAVKSGGASTIAVASTKRAFDELNIKGQTIKIPKLGRVTTPQLAAGAVIIESINEVIKLSNKTKSETFKLEVEVLKLKEEGKVKVNAFDHPGTKLDQRQEFLASEKICLSEEKSSEGEEEQILEASPLEGIETVMDSWDYLDILGNLPPL